MNRTRLIQRLRNLLPLVAAGLLLAACGGHDKTDPHSAPREPKAYESVDVSMLSQSELLAHLTTISSVANEAVKASDAAEFHHLEEAMTPALDALASTVGDKPDALETIDALKALAIKLHEAGHDGNIGMGAKIVTKINELEAKLAIELK